MTRRKYKVVSLFSGAMGLDLGLEKTGRFKVLACVEKEMAFCETIRANQRAGMLDRRLKLYEGDIADLDPAAVLADLRLKPGDVDLLAGGPPCQSFSTAGRRRAVQDPRGTLLWHFLRFVDVMRPKYFVLENVRGLVSAALRHRPLRERPNQGGPPLAPDEKPGSVVALFADDLQAMSGTGYHMDVFEVNAVNYGAPQIRERALFIGNRFNEVVDFPDPTHASPEEAQEAASPEGRPATTPWATLRDAIGDLVETDPVVLDFSPRKKAYLEMVPPGSNWRSLPVEVQKESMGRAWHAKGGRSGWWRRLTPDLPCPTLVTMPNHASTSLCHPTETRALTVREYARIQEFPDDWQVSGTTSQLYAQVGNAVPLRLGEVAGRVVAGSLDTVAARKWRVRRAKREPYRIVYVQSHVRTRQWFKAGSTLVWTDGSKNGHAKYGTPQTRRKVRRIGARQR